jgi:hypothetical protein
MRHPDASAQVSENALKGELAKEILRRFGTLRLQVTGQSMLPSIWPGDILLIERCAFGEIFTGDIVLCAREGRLFAHRVASADVDFESSRLVTQGDALPSPDAPVSAKEVLGKVSKIVRAGKSVEPPMAFTLKNRLVANAARYSTLAARLLVHLHMRHGDSRKREALCKS